MSELYKGIIFNSTTVRALRGQLADTVRERRIRTAVVSNHGKTEVQEALDDAGVTVDVIVGGYDLSRWGEYRKPEPDLLFIAAAKMGLETDDILSVVDCQRDSSASDAAGMDTVEYDPAGMESLIPMLGVGPEMEAPRDFSGIEAPVTGLMGVIVGDVVGSVYEHNRTTDFNFPLFPPRSKPTDDTVGSLAIARWLLGNRTQDNLIRSMVQLCNSYPRAGYGHRFKAWLRSIEHRPYGGNTNGSAMRAGHLPLLIRATLSLLGVDGVIGMEQLRRRPLLFANGGVLGITYLCVVLFSKAGGVRNVSRCGIYDCYETERTYPRPDYERHRPDG